MMDWALPTWFSGLGQAERDARFEQLYLDHAGLVRSVVYLIGGESDLDDIVQETFVKIWRNLHKFEGRSLARTWIYRIAVNSARDHWRKLARRRENLTAQAPEKSVAPADVETSELIRRGLLELSLEQREAVALHYFEGLTLKEIAQIVNAPEGTVKTRLYHGRKALQAWLQEKGIES